MGRVTLKGFNYIHLMKNLKYLNLSNMIDISDDDMEEIVPLLRAVLPPNCTIVASLKANPEIPLLSSGPEPELSEKIQEIEDSETGEIVKYEKTGDLPVDVDKMWGLQKIGSSPDKNTTKRRKTLVALNGWFDRRTNEKFLHYVNKAN